MGVDREDEHFILVMTQSCTRLEEGMFSTGPVLWCKEARSLLESAVSALQEMVDREDREEIEAEDALRALRQARHDLDARCHDVFAALDIRLGELRLAHQSEDEALRPLAQFLNRYHDGEFKGLRNIAALGQARRACDLGAYWEADAKVCASLQVAIDAFEAARVDAGKEGAEAVSAYGELVEGRAIARICYLSARDLVSAALRFEGRYDELDELLPPLSTVFSVGFV